MEENKQKQSSKFNFSVMLSFAVAVFALFSILSFGLATYGKHGGVSYAAPTGVTGNSFNFTIEKSGGNTFQIVSNSGFRVPIYLADDDTSTPVFCVEHMADVLDGAAYSKDGIINDYGLLYLLNHSYANGVSVTGASGADARFVEGWITQTAIWLYLYETDSTSSSESSPNYIAQAQLTAIEGSTSLTLDIPATGSSRDIYSGGTKTLYQYVRELVDNAKAASSARALTVNINSDTPADIAEDKSFYQSPKVTVTDVYGGLQTYDVTIKGVEGAYLVDAAGNKINATGLTADKEFWVRIPADKVGTATVNVTVEATGHFNTLTGHFYEASTGNYQRVVTVTGTTLDVSDGGTFEIIPTPDTGMNVAQTIYFIGLIVLLCGVGIVYANAKPVEIKQ